MCLQEKYFFIKISIIVIIYLYTSSQTSVMNFFRRMSEIDLIKMILLKLRNIISICGALFNNIKNFYLSIFFDVNQIFFYILIKFYEFGYIKTFPSFLIGSLE